MDGIPVTLATRGRSASGRRFHDDRRSSLQAVNLRHLGLQGRRQSPRRADESMGGYVDAYEPHVLFLGLAIVVCSCLDAFFTLNLLQAGAVEMNVLMARLIESDIQSFVNAKIALTCLCVTLLIIHKNFRVFMGLSVRNLLQWILAGYLTLIGYELFLLNLPPL